MKLDLIDEEAQQKLFEKYLIKENYVFEIIKDGYDLDDEYKIIYEEDTYYLLYSGPEFVLRYNIQYEKENREKLKKIANYFNEDLQLGGISYFEDDSYDDFFIFIPLLFVDTNDINKYFKNYLNIMQSVKIIFIVN